MFARHYCKFIILFVIILSFNIWYGWLNWQEYQYFTADAVPASGGIVRGLDEPGGYAGSDQQYSTEIENESNPIVSLNIQISEDDLREIINSDLFLTRVEKEPEDILVEGPAEINLQVNPGIDRNGDGKPDYIPERQERVKQPPANTDSLTGDGAGVDVQTEVSESTSKEIAGREQIDEGKYYSDKQVNPDDSYSSADSVKVEESVRELENPFTLLAVSYNPGGNRAILLNKYNNNSFIVSEGDQVEEFTVSTISKTLVTLEMDGQSINVVFSQE